MSKMSLTFVLIALQLVQILTTSAAPTVDSQIYPTLRKQGQVNVILTMAPSVTTARTTQTLENYKRSTIINRVDRINSVVNLLKTEAANSQSDLLNFIDQVKSPLTQITPLWITNKIIVNQADHQLIQKLSSRSDIAKIDTEKFIEWEKPVPVSTNLNPRAGEQWGVAKIGAPTVWQAGINGSNVIVSHIDSGVRATHESIRASHRVEYGWFDADGGTATPNDQLGHGTHTMGSIVGAVNGIGVAPNAQWITCKACTDDCPDSKFLRCGEFILCPTDPQGQNEDCSKAPHLVSNSWGGFSEEWYDDVILAWRAAGIIPIFSAGNDGPSCETLGYPGENPDVIAVGSTTEDDELSYFSSVGPTYTSKQRKPEISAPGSDVYSADNGGDALYSYKSGTSMASPHVAGLVALLLSADPTLDYDQIKSLLEQGAVHIQPTGDTCGGIKDDVYPNNHAGYGRISAINSVANLTLVN